MPELPEVETVRRKLEQVVSEKTISSVDVRVPSMIRTSDVPTFCAALTHMTITRMDRRGKHLLFQLNESHYLVSHLRMEGKYHFYDDDIPERTKHDHIVFYFTDGSELRYHDVRKFGTMDLVKKEELLTISALAELGLEPMDSAATAAYLHHKLSSKRVVIKNALLDQRILAGLGNIYVDEVLHASGIHPERIASSITLTEADTLLHHSARILTLGIQQGGASVRSYNSLGEQGNMQQLLHVYARENLPCTKCKTPIKKIKVSGRGTHFCPTCQ